MSLIVNEGLSWSFVSSVTWEETLLMSFIFVIKTSEIISVRRRNNMAQVFAKVEIGLLSISECSSSLAFGIRDVIKDIGSRFGILESLSFREGPLLLGF